MAQSQPKCNRRKAAKVAHRARSRAPQDTLRSRGSGHALPSPDQSPQAHIGSSRPPRATAGSSNAGRCRSCIQASCHWGRQRQRRPAPASTGRSATRKGAALSGPLLTREDKTTAVGTARALLGGGGGELHGGEGRRGRGAPAAHGGAAGARLRSWSSRLD
jgi:hypothetical protein